MEEKNNNEPAISEEEMKMPEEEYAGSVTPTEETSYLGMILGVLIVILVLLLGGLYLWGTTLQDQLVPTESVMDRPTAEENNEPESNTADAQVEALNTVSTSDELSAIEADLESTNIEELDAEANAIDAEVEASEQ